MVAVGLKPTSVRSTHVYQLTRLPGLYYRFISAPSRQYLLQQPPLARLAADNDIDVLLLVFVACHYAGCKSGVGRPAKE
jgi:hypothetical protein